MIGRSVIDKQGARNIAEYKQRWNETKNVDFLRAMKNAIGMLLSHKRKDLLDALVSRGVLNGYAIDRNLHLYPIRLTPRELNLFGADPSAVDWDAERRSIEQYESIQHPAVNR